MAKVMVAEQYDSIRYLLRTVLTSVGHEVVVEVNNGPDVLSTFHSTLPDIVSLDLRLPSMDGFELMKHIKSTSPNTRIIAYSSGIHAVDVEMAISCGASVAFDKPFDLDDYLKHFQ
ncbi:response regulator [Paenibacillus piri]|nr:response regulator [Paenibacillus piri]